MIWYRTLFLNRKTFTAAAIGMFSLLIVSVGLMALSGQLTIFTAACYLLVFVMSAGLAAAWKKEDLLLTLFSSSAFFHTYELTSRHENVVGAHASKGIYYEGAAEKNLSAFTFYDGEAHFTLENPDEAVRTAAERGGEGFEQFMTIWNGTKTRDILAKRRCYRVMAELNWRVCIIESARIMRYVDFIRKVQDMGVKTALYLDMGARSSYSQYRRNDGKVINLFGKRGEFVHSWVGFYK